MATATEREGITKPKMLKSWKLRCPLCGASEAINLNLNDLAVVACSECGEDFHPAAGLLRASEELKRWQALVAWIEMAGERLAAQKSTESE